jgi:hypothetical protein
MSVFSYRLFAVLLFSLNLNLFSQTELYLPKEIKSAYLKNTRSFDGKPGELYWQNHSAYKINASIDPVSKLLTGSESVIYTNNSPDTLKRLVFKLYQNLNKKGASRNVNLPEEAVTEGMNIISVKINNAEFKTDPSSKMINIQGTNLIINLAEALLPKEKVEVEIDWSFVIPVSATPRMGVTDSVTYFVAYWYPKIAVYDDINGWDMHSYNGEHEFYFEYSDFEVSLTMPYGFIIWSTGTPRNLNEILSDEILARYKKGLAADSVIKIITTPDLVKKNIFRKNEKKFTWKFYAENIPDFAFGTSTHYVWQMTSVKMNGRSILAHTAFNPDNETYNEVIHFARGAVEQFPQGLQGVPYPYHQITVFNGDSGMEFPMIVNDAAFPNRSTDVYVTIHEITHMFFPFFTAMSESRYGWFDEGMAYFLPQKIQMSFDPADHRVRAAKGYASYAGRETDLPLMTPSFLIREPDLSMLSYYKSAVAFDMLRDLLGDDLFRKCLEEFILRWNGKHPTPYDFFYTFNNISGKEINWFWQKWFFEKGFPDLAVKDVKASNGKVEVLIERVGNYPVPLQMILTAPDGRKEIFNETSGIWSGGNSEIWINAGVSFDPVLVEIGAPWIPDSNPLNNKWEQKP